MYVESYAEAAFDITGGYLGGTSYKGSKGIVNITGGYFEIADKE